MLKKITLQLKQCLAKEITHHNDVTEALEDFESLVSGFAPCRGWGLGWRACRSAAPIRHRRKT